MNKKTMLLGGILLTGGLMVSRVGAAEDVRVCVQVIQKDLGTDLKDAASQKSKASDGVSVDTSATEHLVGEMEDRQGVAPAERAEINDDSMTDASPNGEMTASSELVRESHDVGATVERGNGSVPGAESATGDDDVSVPDETPIADDRVQMNGALPDGATVEQNRDVAGIMGGVHGDEAIIYLRRLVEHYITHQEGYASATDDCQEQMTIELYPLERGWTVFARYSGTNREEKIDQMYPSELSQFSERAVLALLNDVPIHTTINRENVLAADSRANVQRVKGSNHFTMNVGTRIMFGMIDTVETRNGDQNVEPRFRGFHPMLFGLGYRGRYENWGLEVQAHLGVGGGRKYTSSNTDGGHVDYGGDTGLGIHFLKYTDPRGLTSFYLGGGGTFTYAWYVVVNPESAISPESFLHTGGLQVDGLFGWEFMRAAAVQFFIQGEFNLPAYITRSESRFGKIESWVPGVALKIGVVF